MMWLGAAGTGHVEGEMMLVVVTTRTSPSLAACLIQEETI